MDLTEALLAILTAITTASFGVTQWRLARVERDLVSKPDRSELTSELAPIRADITALRADLTQIASAVGAARPRKAE